MNTNLSSKAVDGAHPPRPEASAPRGVVGWQSPNVFPDSVLPVDATRCVVGLALYVPETGDGGPEIREGYFDSIFGFMDATTGMRIKPRAWSSPTLAQQPAAHPDDAAVDSFAAAMKAKLADARANGRGGWDGNESGMQQRLSDMLRTHVEKGDPRDVANFAMFLHQRGEVILPAQVDGPVYGIIDPDYARIFTIARVLAWAEGYALAMHGSFTRDLDLIATPWTDAACEPEHLASRIAAAADLKGRADNPGIKPHGRLVWTLRLPGFGEPRWVDLSIMPRALAQQPAAVDEVRIPVTLAERVQSALGKFTSDEGWCVEDMQTADDFGAALAAQQGDRADG